MEQFQLTKFRHTSDSQYRLGDGCLLRRKLRYACVNSRDSTRCAVPLLSGDLSNHLKQKTYRVLWSILSLQQI